MSRVEPKGLALSLAIAAGLAGLGTAAQAVQLNPDGLGQVLVYPYYTTRGGNDTMLSVVNTSQFGKAVKVRFLEGRNGRPVADFHLYLSEFDVWTAAIGHVDALGPGLVTFDRSCTVPDIARGGFASDGGTVLPPLFGDVYFLPFTNAAFSGVAQDHGDDIATTLSSLDRTREGHIEVIEMANIVPDSQLSLWTRHTASGEPSDCLALNRAWSESDGAFQQDSGFGLQAPTGKGELAGNAMIVNPFRGTVLGYAADAIAGFNHRILHGEPGAEFPNLGSVNDPGPDGADQATARVARSGDYVEATFRDDVPFGKIDAISALYVTPKIINEYYLDQDVVSGSSEWVVTFPTRRYYIDSRPAQPDGNPFLSPAGSARAPFSSAFGDDGSCQQAQATYFNREQRVGLPPMTTPPPRPPRLCWQAQVLSFRQAGNFVGGLPSAILGAEGYLNLAPPNFFETGWAQLAFLQEPAMRASVEGVQFQGLPATGFFAANYDNEGLHDGVLANYSMLFRHRTEMECSGSEQCL